MPAVHGNTFVWIAGRTVGGSFSRSESVGSRDPRGKLLDYVFIVQNILSGRAAIAARPARSS